MSAEPPFFVGYLGVPKGVRGFLAGVAAGAVALAALLGFVIAATADDPGGGTLRFDYGRQSVTGVVAEQGYPVLRVTEGNDRLPAGRTLMLSGVGKTGLQPRLSDLVGRTVRLEGIVVERGALEMLQVANGEDAVRPVSDATPAPPPAEDLGRWRLTGELCDGKCLVGAMRPGRGIAHKACANLCIIGGVPMVFVSTRPLIEDDPTSAFLMVTGPRGGAVSRALLDATASIIDIEGRVERIGDLLVLRAEPGTLAER